jgi:hypothetical protein
MSALPKTMLALLCGHSFALANTVACTVDLMHACNKGFLGCCQHYIKLCMSQQTDICVRMYTHKNVSVCVCTQKVECVYCPHTETCVRVCAQKHAHMYCTHRETCLHKNKQRNMCVLCMCVTTQKNSCAHIHTGAYVHAHLVRSMCTLHVHTQTERLALSGEPPPPEPPPPYQVKHTHYLNCVGLPVAVPTPKHTSTLCPPLHSFTPVCPCVHCLAGKYWDTWATPQHITHHTSHHCTTALRSTPWQHHYIIGQAIPAQSLHHHSTITVLCRSYIKFLQSERHFPGKPTSCLHYPRERCLYCYKAQGVLGGS